MPSTKRTRPQTPTSAAERRSKVLKALNAPDLGASNDSTAHQETSPLEDADAAGINELPDPIKGDTAEQSPTAVESDAGSSGPADIFAQVVG